MQETQKNSKTQKKNKGSELIQKIKGNWLLVKDNTLQLLSNLSEYISRIAKQNIKSSELLKEYSILAATSVFGFLMGIAQMPQVIRPLGISALCSFSDKNKALCAYAGVSAACLTYGNDALVSFIIYFMLYAARKVFTDSQFKESQIVRIIESAVCSLAIGIIRISTDNEAFIYSSVALISLICISCAFTYFFSTIFNKELFDCTKLSVISICNYALMSAIVCSLDGIVILGFDIQLAVSCIITLCYAAVNGFLHAGTVGFVCSLMCASPSVSACIGISGIICALIMSKSMPAALISYVCSFFIYTSYTNSLTYSLALLPSVILGCLAFFPVCGILSEPIRLTVKPSKTRFHSADTALFTQNHKTLSEAFFSLSSVFSKLSEKQKYPCISDIDIIVDKSFTDICVGCALSEMCYAKSKTDINQLKSTLFSVLATREVIPEDMGAHMNSKCIRLEKLCEEINRFYKQTAVCLAGDNRTTLLAAQYAGMARLIVDAEHNMLEKSQKDPAFEKSISLALTQADIPFSYIDVYSGREKKTKIHGISPEKIPFGAQELKKYIFAKCALHITEPSFDISESSDMIMSFERAPLVNVEYSQACLAKQGKSVNGDTVNFTFDENNHFHAYICDGMGSGREAATSSRLSSLFLENMLSSGTKKSIILELLNNVLLSRSGESFSTVDLFEADLLTGKCCFVKAGAAPTYILRGSKLYKIFSATPPVGIISGFTAESTSFDVEPGDVIIMMSDGVVQNNEDSAWLAELIRVDTAKDPSVLAKTILDKSKEINSRADDMSVAVIKVSAAA